jgi:hypothetical protein
MSTHDELPHLDLNALVRPVAKVDLDDQSYEVLPVQGEAMSIFEEIAAEQRAQRGRPEIPDDEKADEMKRYLDRARRIVHAVAPTIPKERVSTLTVSQLMAIASLAMNPVKAVQELRQKSAGKGRGPAPRVPRTRSGRR